MNTTITFNGRTLPLWQFVADSRAFTDEAAVRLIATLAARGAITASDLVYACLGITVTDATYGPAGNGV